MSVSGGGDSLTLRANGVGALAMMSVRTDARAYDFELVANRGARVPVMLRIDEPAPPPTTEPIPEEHGFRKTWPFCGLPAWENVPVPDSKENHWIRFLAAAPVWVFLTAEKTFRKRNRSSTAFVQPVLTLTIPVYFETSNGGPGPA